MKTSEIFDVTGTSVVVTGAASGLGRAIAEAFSDNGARVVLVDWNREALAQAEQELRARGGAVWSEYLDVSDFEAVNLFFDKVAERQGGIDTVFANAGKSTGSAVSRPEGRLLQVTREQWVGGMDVNLHGAFATVQAAARQMLPRKRGAIIVTASIAGLKPNIVSGYAYHVAKAGVAHLARVAAKELGAEGVRINVIAPGPFATNIGNGRLRNSAAVGDFVSTVPLGRVADPAEIKGLALLLGSPASSYINGAVIPIDGGDSA